MSFRNIPQLSLFFFVRSVNTLVVIHLKMFTLAERLLRSSSLTGDVTKPTLHHGVQAAIIFLQIFTLPRHS